MRSLLRRGSVVNTLAVMSIAVCPPRAQSAKSAPVVALCGQRGAVHRMFDTLLSGGSAPNVSGKPLPGRHFLPEEIPDETLTELLAFLKL